MAQILRDGRLKLYKYVAEKETEGEGERAQVAKEYVN